MEVVAMSTEKERLLVLRAVSDGLVSASGGAKLLKALEQAQAVGGAAEEERLQILNMVSQGQVSASGATKLLAALDQAQGGGPAVETRPGRWFRVRVTDIPTGKSKVNINIPMSLVNVGMKMGARFAPSVDDEHMEAIREAIKQGIQGKILDAEDDEDGERVEIFID
jgi:hypothetical protein